MIKKLFCFIFFASLVIPKMPSFASETPSIGEHFGRDLLTSASYLYKGSYKQFQSEASWYYMGATTPLLAFAFMNDKDISRHQAGKPKRDHLNLISNTAIFANLPLIPIGTYIIGRNLGNEKLIRFAMEYTATLYLTLTEVFFMSMVNVHKRPTNEELTGWETQFRRESSFPSGHVVPYATLTFKTLQFYGPYAAIAPALVTVLVAQERVRSRKHYLSDVIGSVLFSGMASEGVRLAANHQNNHPFYKTFYEHDIKLSILPTHDSVLGTFSFKF